MTALPLEPHTEAEEATLKRIEGAEPDENGAVEKVARAMCDGDAEDNDTYTWDEASDELRDDYRRAACHAIGAMKGGSRAEEALARVEALAERLGDESREFYYDNRHTHENGINYVSGMSDAMEQIADRIAAAIASPQTGER